MNINNVLSDLYDDMDDFKLKLGSEVSEFVERQIKVEIERIRESEMVYQNAYRDLVSEIQGGDKEDPTIAYLLDYIEDSFITIHEAMQAGKTVRLLPGGKTVIEGTDNVDEIFAKVKGE